MSNNNTTLVIGGQSFATNMQAPQIGSFMAAKFGISIPKREKGVKGPTVKELVLAKGHTAEEYKLANKELAGLKQDHYRNSALLTGAAAADPTMRKSVRFSFRKKDNTCIGFSTTFRKETSPGMSAAARKIAELEALVASLRSTQALTA